MKKFFIYIFFGILFLYLNLTPIPRFLRGYAQILTNPISFFLSESYEGLNNVYNTFAKVGELREENTVLEKKLKQSQKNLVLSLEKLSEYEDLESLESYFNPEESLIANVIGKRKVSGETLFILDTGQRSSISEDDIVVEGGYLVGSVVLVYPNESMVRTILSEKIEIPVESVNSGASGIYKCVSNDCFVDKILNSDPLEIGDIFITSGIGGSYKRGLILGEVDRIDSQPQQAFKRAYLFSPLNIDRISKVGVVGD